MGKYSKKNLRGNWQEKNLQNVMTAVRTSKISNNSNKSPTRCNNFPVYYPDVYLQLNMFQAFSRPSSGAQ